jgi:hypothetical protein
MANATYEAQMGTVRANPAVYANIVGSVISIAVFVGIIGWGAQTILRDSSGVPVVRALDGPVRIAPEHPGGILVPHQGLSVNEVASSQGQVSLEDRLQLAPRPINLQAEDQPSATLMAASAALQDNSPLSLMAPEYLIASEDLLTVDQTAEGLANMLAASALTIPNVLGTDQMGSSMFPASAGLGLTQSLRPRVRPAMFKITQASVLVARTSNGISRGAPMAQLGAFSSQDIATQAWADLSQRHGDYLVGKPHVILKADVGGSTIYRLRVHGFMDSAEARRLCTALTGQNTECYSVVMN